MRRRELLLASAAIAISPLARAQQPGRVFRVGWLGAWVRPPEGARDARREAFLEGMRDLGYFEGRNLVVEARYLARSPQAGIAQMEALAKELVAARVEVILATNTLATEGARNATTSLPIVMGTAANPVAAGLIQSLARPGGNITGLTLNTGEIAAKRLELLKGAIPALRRVGAVYPTEVRTYSVVVQWLRDCEAAARALGVELVPVELSVNPESWDDSFRKMAAARLEAVTVVESLSYAAQRANMTALALRNRIAVAAFVSDFVEAGALLSYGAEFDDLYRRAAGFVDKILKGASPADLPVELPTRFTFAVNAGTAKALGIRLPQSLLLRADRVVE